MWFKKKCDHHWHEVVTRTEKEYENTGVTIDTYDECYTYLYCPICDKSNKIRSSEAVLVLKKQEIKMNYNNGSEFDNKYE
ncbi:hypothetical protein DN757_28585 [Paenibacillus silvae]|uniref:Uncharacterized protein n=1 Tax=Paenibacillus silvae TaxID=1325358 RepID=A0A2W6N906_9BACL|nr:hypothetical protein DN757_28585 [Paenibacillus silvae]